VAHCENEIEIKFPIIGDADRKVSEAFGMLDVSVFVLPAHP
jgi:alkyl hydroperoxide reductase subunit AhpC